jgi:hypothetical protein
MRYHVLLGILIWTLIVIGSPPTVGADIIMTLDATSGSLRQFQDSAFGSGVSGPGFGLGGFGPQIGRALPFPVSNLVGLSRSQLQLIDQSGQLLLYAPSVGINGHLCCGMIGALNISVIPSVPVPGSGVGAPTLVVTSPFTASGVLRTTISTTNLFDQGPYGEYLFQGSGTMTSVFRASCGPVNDPCYSWNESVLTFAPTVPEPSTWLLLGSGLVAVLLSRRRLMSQPAQPHGSSW